MFQRKMKKLTASLLLFFMVFSIMPVQVWAEESTTGSAIEWVPNEDECTDPSHNHGTEGDNADGTEGTDATEGDDNTGDADSDENANNGDQAASDADKDADAEADDKNAADEDANKDAADDETKDSEDEVTKDEEEESDEETEGSQYHFKLNSDGLIEVWNTNTNEIIKTISPTNAANAMLGISKMPGIFVNKEI